jgi:hypothetical protein
MKSRTLAVLIALVVATPLLSACSASCDCPKCPARTTVINPPPNSSTTIPND